MPRKAKEEPQEPKLKHKLEVKFASDWRPGSRKLAARGDWREDLLRKFDVHGSIDVKVGPGYRLLLERMFERLIADGWDRNLGKVSEHVGGISVPLSQFKTPTQQFIAMNFSMESYHTCSECGRPGTMTGITTKKSVRIMNLCPEDRSRLQREADDGN